MCFTSVHFNNLPIHNKTPLQVSTEPVPARIDQIVPLEKLEIVLLSDVQLGQDLLVLLDQLSIHLLVLLIEIAVRRKRRL